MDKRLEELSDYRLEQAERCIKSARILVADDDYKGAANRSYYAIFHCMRSVLALEGVEEQIRNAERFCLATEKYIKGKKDE